MLYLQEMYQVLGEVDKEVLEENQYSTQECETTPSEVSKESKVSVVSEILETTTSKKCNEKEKDSTNDEEKLLIDLELHDDFAEDETIEPTTEKYEDLIVLEGEPCTSQVGASDVPEVGDSTCAQILE